MIVIKTCPKCGHDLIESIITTMPPIPRKECLHCGWSWEGNSEKVTIIPCTDIAEAKMLYINLNQQDIDKLDCGELTVFAVPMDKSDTPPYQTGNIIGIREPFKNTTCIIQQYENGKVINEDIVAGVRYRSDEQYVWETGVIPPNNEFYLSTIDDAPKWSASRMLPEYAIRRFATVIKVEHKLLSEFTEEDIKSMRLDYASQNNPQLLIEEYTPIKNRELLLTWWYRHYKSTLKDGKDPMVVILHFAPTEAQQK